MAKEGGTHIDNLREIKHKEYQCCQCNATFDPHWKSCQRCGGSMVYKKDATRRQKDN